MSIDYKSWYESAKAELHNLQQEKAGLESAVVDRGKQIAALIQTINAIAPLVGEERANTPDARPVGITDGIRMVLEQADKPLSAAEIRDRLAAIGFDMNSYSNPLAVTHTILKRLIQMASVEVEARELNVRMPGGKKFKIPTGKKFTIGKVKGFVGAGRLKFRKKSVQ